MAIPSAATHDNEAAVKAALVLNVFEVFHSTALPISTPIKAQETSCFKRCEHERRH
jgi:hypothetical protein